MSNVRTTLTAVAAIVFVSLTAACGSGEGSGSGRSGGDKAAGAAEVAGGSADGGVGGGVAGGADNAALCAEAVAASGDFMSKVMAAVADPKGTNTAISDHVGTLKKISERADGDLKTALSEMVDALSQLNVDSVTAAEVSKKADAATKKLMAACS
ncbi:hypothetical protein IMZ11_38870 [Microtetraspora sp. AC03309]|uniref:hypothetical protein n=1 Tax=Microtetraspora sp. AC03309 TaxID=2779376 RepID=UPI001E600B2C|nr:hypothetical protein [Microtetraspora sp. AC03309]MCC5581582.1 hypothetical protein [Microtetraspora sp. AC03309]